MENSDQTRITLIERVQDQHDEASWREFEGIYHGFIYGVVRRMNISEHDAEDIVQQVLITLWKKLPKQDVRTIKRFRSWVSTITKNCVIDFIRKRTSEITRWEKAARDETAEYLQGIRLPEINALAEKQWQIHITNRALENIKPLFFGKAMEVFQLSLQGRSIGEIAIKLDLKERSVSRLKTRVKNQLTQEIERLREEFE